MFTLYILYSHISKQIYVGQTQNLAIRLSQHGAGLVRSTKNKRPLLLIHQEMFSTRSEVMKREKFLKSLPGSKIKIQILKKFLADGSSKP